MLQTQDASFAGKTTVTLQVGLINFPSIQPANFPFLVTIENSMKYKPPYFKPNLPASISFTMLNSNAEQPYDFIS